MPPTTDARTSYEAALRAAADFPAVTLGRYPTPVDEMARLAGAIAADVRLLVKRDDAIPFAFGGNKVRKLELVAAHARAEGADTLVTVGGVQSNHARVTAAAAATLGMGCVIIANGAPPERPTANALLHTLLGAEVEYVATREERAAASARAASRVRRAGHTPYEIPLGASTPLGALGFVRAVGELVGQGVTPDVIIHAASSAGTQAGLAAGCALHGLPTRVIGVSADDPAADIAARVRDLIAGLGALLGVDGDALAAACAVEMDDSFVGAGYGAATPASQEAQQLAARTEALFVDHTYTAKALAALIAYARSRRLPAGGTVLFWHTGAQVGLFA